MKFVNIKGITVNTDHVSAVGPASKVSGDEPEGYFCVYLLGAGTQNPLFVYGKGKQLIADRNRLLRAMGAIV